MKSIAFSVATVAVLVGLFLALRPASQPVAEPATAPVVISPKVFELVIGDKKLVSGDANLRVRQGERVVLRVTSDRADELHLHGYDLSLKLAAGVTGELAFSADRSGRFDYELHHSHVELGALEVLPR